MQRSQRPLLLAIDLSATPLELHEHVAGALSNGFDGVELCFPDGFEQLQPGNSHLNTIPIRAVAMRCEMMGSLSAVRFLSTQLQAASSLGTKLLNLSIPPVRRSNDGVGFTRYQDALNFTHELLQRVRFEAEATGVNVALEAPSGGFLLSPIEVRELLDAVNSSAVGACLDVEQIAALGLPLDWIDTLHRRVRAVRYSDESFSGISAAAKVSQSPIATLIQALDGVPSDCPLILSQRPRGADLPGSGASVRVSRTEAQSETDEYDEG